MDKMLEKGKIQIEKRQAEIAADLKEQSAKLSTARKSGEAKLQAKINTTKAEILKAEDLVAARIEETRREADAKIASLKKHAPKVQEKEEKNRG